MALNSNRIMVKLGKAFSDSVIVERGSGKRPHVSFSRLWWIGSGRALFFTTVFFIAFFILLWRLFDLTIIQGRTYRALADSNRIREVIRHAPRGILRDRTGKPLVANITQYRLVKPCEGETAETCIEYLTKEEGEALKGNLPPGSILEEDYQRRYIHPESTAHVVGITGELNRKELSDEYYAIRNYKRGDRVGRSGIEAIFEERLRGQDGRELIETDAAGVAIRTLGVDKESPGEEVVLSLDAGLSDAVAQAFPSDADGAVVVTKPATGEILAIYSSPSFSPNLFSMGMSQTDYDALVTNPRQPLFNRAIGGVYPPGSTFKIVTSVAALEVGAVTPDTRIEDVGVLTIGRFTFPNWYFTQYGRRDGSVDIVRAIQRSNDIFFYKTGEILGIHRLAQWARTLGVGNPSGIEIGGEASGLMPDPEWKNQLFTDPIERESRQNEWYLGDTYHVAIGQGYLLTTPLQVNAWTNVIANGGKLCKPTIGKVTRDRRQGTSSCKDLGIQPQTIALVSEGMRRACEPGGTGWPLFNFSVRRQETRDKQESQNETASSSGTLVRVPVACKTGTAEFGDPNERTHAWFTVFAPIPKEFVPDSGNQDIKSDQIDAQGPTLSEGEVLTGEPEISVTVLVEGGGEGSYVAAPIAKTILEEWFSR